MPDPVEAPAVDKAAARRLLGLPPGARIAGCAGAIDERKGMDHLLRAFSRVAKAGDHLLLAGKLSPQIRGLLDACPTGLRARIHAPDRFLDDEAFGASLAAMDLVCTPYPDHVGSASIVIRAAAAGKPVLAADTGWMQAIVPRFGLGATVAVKDGDALAQALAAGLEKAPDHVSHPAAAAFVAFHAPGNFAACWTARLRERLGVHQAPGRIDWSDLP
jgi:glycosyltransferase involved in cell wall biosynthesis